MPPILPPFHAGYNRTQTDTNGSQTTAHHSGSGHQRTTTDVGGKNSGGGSDSRKTIGKARQMGDVRIPASRHAPNFAPSVLRLAAIALGLAITANSPTSTAATATGKLTVTARVEHAAAIRDGKVNTGAPFNSTLAPALPASSPKLSGGVLTVEF